MSDEKRHEESTVRDSDRFRALIAASAEVTWHTDARGEPVGDNLSWRKFTGQSVDDVRAGCWTDAIHPDDRARVLDAISRGFTGQVPWQVEERLHRFDGEWQHMMVCSVPIRGSDGAVYEWIGSCQDITELKKAQDVLRKKEGADRAARREERLREAERVAKIGYWELDIPSGKIERSDQDVRNFGLKPGEMRPDFQHFLECVHPGDREMVGAWAAATLKTLTPNEYEFRALWPDGQVRSIRVKVQFEVDEKGTSKKAFGCSQDITDLKKVQDALARSQERYRLVETAVNDGIWDLNVLDGEAYLSPRWKAILGYADEEFPNLYSSFADHIHPDDKPNLEEDIHAHLEENKPHAMDFRLRCKNGEYRWVHGRGKALRDASGRPIRMVGTITDITERRQTAELLAQAQKMEAVGQLTASIAHDFNNLLAVIAGGHGFVAEAAKRGLTADPEIIEAVQRAIGRGADLVKRLLVYSRQSPLKAEPTAIDQLVLDTLRLLQRSLGEQIEIVTQLNAPGAIASIDRGQLVNAILNLAVNARDAMPEGGQLTISTTCKPTARAATNGHAHWPTGEEIRISVSDTGIGMTEAVRARAVEPFFTTKPDGLGSGLGLSMVMGFVEQSGGHLEIDTAVEQGTAITICLPRIDAVATKDEQGAVDERAEAPTERAVLLVEDDLDVRTVMAAQLKGLGYKVYAVGTAMEALDMIASPAEIDIMLTDMVLPGGVDGMTLLKEATRARPDMGLLCMSGYDPTQGHRKWLNIQNIGFLEKPFSKAQLAQALEQAVAS